MFIGINGYTKPGDKYDALLPAVSSWTLDRRKKASKLNNFAGGFSSSTNKNDEYRFYSITWQELPENDFSEATTSQDIYESVSSFTAKVGSILVTGSTTHIVPISLNIESGTTMWIKKSNNSYNEVQLLKTYKAGESTIQLKSMTGKAIPTTSHDQLVLHKSRGLGLLSLASLAATGSTHLLRDFMGNLVKIIFQSPKYNALAGTDEYGQMYYDVKIDIDLVSDTASAGFKANKGIQVNVSNESLPRINSFAGGGGSYDLSSFFIRDASTFNLVQLGTFKAGTNYQLSTVSQITPNTPTSSGGGMPLLSMSRKIGIFKNFISASTQLNLKFIGNNGMVIRDDVADGNDIELSINVPELIYGGVYNKDITYGDWANYAADGTYVAGTYVKQNSVLYVCIQGPSTAVPLTDTKVWYRIPDNTPIVVSLENKYYKLIVPTSKGKDPKQNPSDWIPYTLTVSDMFFKGLPALTNTISKTDSLIFVIQPYTFQNASGDVNKSSIILRVPVVDGPVIQDLDLNDQASITKIATLYPTSNDTLSATYLGNNMQLTGNYGLNYYQNSQLGSTVLAYPSTTTGSKSWDYSRENYLLKYNIEQCMTKLVNYTVLNIRGTGNTQATISDGLVTLGVSKNNVHNNVTIRFAHNLIPVKVSGTGTATVTTRKTLLQSFNMLALDKMLIETVLDPVPVNDKFRVTQTAYWITLDPDYANGIKVVEDNPTESGLSLIKHKSTITFLASAVIDSETTIKPVFSQANAAQYVDLASCISYTMQPVSQQYITKFFSLEDNIWT